MSTTRSPVENERDHRETIEHMRDGPGTVTLRHFRFHAEAAMPRFLILEIPPDAAEGVHTHYADDRNGTGAYDEYYYIIAGRGVMTLGSASFAVGAGDYIHAPLDLPRGIANADPSEPLKIHLTVALSEPARAPPAAD